MNDNNNPNDDLDDIILPDDLNDDSVSDTSIPDDIQDRIDEVEEEEKPEEDQTKSPSLRDDDWQTGTTMDDDVDVLGEEILGEGYKDTEPIDITKKYSPTSKIEPPEQEEID